LPDCYYEGLQLVIRESYFVLAPPVVDIIFLYINNQVLFSNSLSKNIISNSSNKTSLDGLLVNIPEEILNKRELELE
jgi:hypothetical protein